MSSKRSSAGTASRRLTPAPRRFRLRCSRSGSRASPSTSGHTGRTTIPAAGCSSWSGAAGDSWTTCKGGTWRGIAPSSRTWACAGRKTQLGRGRRWKFEGASLRSCLKPPPPPLKRKRRHYMSTTMVQEQAAVSATVGHSEISFETGKLAKQADGSVVVRSGETMVLATAMGRTEAREGADFFPLTVDVEERMYAAGKIPGGFFKREGRPTERAILTARMIDRPIRPLWPRGFRNEVQVICTVLSADMVTPHDILCINGASAALMVSPLPFMGPVGAVRVGQIDDELVVNPTLPEVEEQSTLDLVVVGTKEGLTMVEAGADEIPEDVLLEALERAHAEIIRICEAQEQLREQAGKRRWLDPELTGELHQRYGSRIRERILAEGLREAAATID